MTSLRFIAAFAVLVLHFRDLLGPLPDWVMRGIVGGQYGVTFFFVLSGFILSYRYQGWFAHGVDGVRYARFQRFRFARLYPVYLLGLLLDTPWHLMERAAAGQLAVEGTTLWASWLINLVGLQAWVPAVPFAMYWNTPAWSVAAEFFFYACFPFVCAALARWPRGQRGRVGLFAASLLGGAGLYALVIYFLNYVVRVQAETQYIVLVYNPLLRFSEFFAGCVAGHLWLHRPAQDALARRRVRDACIVASTLLVCLRVWLPDYTGPSPWLWLLDVSFKYAAFVLPFTAIILAVASGRTLLSPLLECRGMVLLGEASYALYILHWPVRSFLLSGVLGAWSTPAVHALCMLSTVGLAVLCYRYVELPWRNRLRGGAPSEPFAGRRTLQATG